MCTVFAEGKSDVVLVLMVPFADVRNTGAAWRNDHLKVIAGRGPALGAAAGAEAIFVDGARASTAAGTAQGGVGGRTAYGGI
jgi:hypothetical protein